MDISLLLVGLVLVVGVVLLAVLAATVIAGSRRSPAPSQGAAAAQRHATVVNVTAWLVAFLLSPLVLTVASGLIFRSTGGAGIYVGLTTALYPTLVGVLFLAVHAIGERTWPRPSGTLRRAALTRREVRDVTPARLRSLLWIWSGGLAVALIGFGLTATEGRRVSGGDAVTTLTASPYPGWFYGVPLLAATAVVVLGAEGVLRLVAGRPAVVDADPAYDAASRRLSAHRVLRGAQLVVAWTFAGVLGVAGVAVSNVGRPAGGVLTVLALVVGMAGLVAALWPGRAPVPGPASDPGAQRGGAGAVDQVPNSHEGDAELGSNRPGGSGPTPGRPV